MALKSINKAFLHNEFCAQILKLEIALADAGVELLLYEAWRSPERQADLFARGRGLGLPNRFVTRARSWESLHQYGMACDFAHLDLRTKQWTWWPSKDPRWTKFHDLAHRLGLVTLSFEKPHVQMPGVTIPELRAGHYPPGGGTKWDEFLSSKIREWGPQPRVDEYGNEQPGAPAPPEERPELEDVA